MKILFVHNAMSSFIRTDLEILRSAHEVRELAFRPNPACLKQIFAGVAWCDLVFGWWASWHMLAPALLAKAQSKGVIVVGGDYDVIYDSFARQKDVQNPLLRDSLRWQLGSILFPKIDQFVTNSEYSKAETLKLPFVRPEQVTRIYHGLSDLAQNRPREKTNLVLAVGRISHYDILKKGWGTYVKATKLLSQHHFEMVGSWKDDGINLLRQWNDRNISYTGFIPENELLQKMAAAKVIVQVSYREGFGLALAEAMLFECAPVVTNRCSIPEVVGDTGLYVPYGDPVSTAAAIEEAFHRQSELGPRARSRILDLYPLEKRREQFLGLVEKIHAQHD